jgi:hypothetical protein
LFFDLLFGFAVSQLSHHPREHLPGRGFVETLGLLAIFAVWAYTSWAAILIAADQSRTTRIVLGGIHDCLRDQHMRHRRLSHCRPAAGDTIGSLGVDIPECCRIGIGSGGMRLLCGISP